MKPSLKTDVLERCYVHIGAPKTGTTYLQQMCWENRALLAQTGILYPSTGARRGGHHDFAFLIHGSYPDWATPQPRTLQELEADLAAELRTVPKGSSVLLSSEDFYMFPHPQALRDLLGRTGALSGRRPAIIVYVRRQDAAHESWYNQTIKALGYAHTINECIANFEDLFDYDTNLKRWGAVFGEDAVIVRPYEEQQFVGGTLASDFFNLLGIPDAGISPSQDRVNTGLNYDLLEIQRCINKLPLPVLEKRKFHKQMIELSRRAQGTGLFDEGPVIDAKRAREVLKAYAAGNERVARRYFGRADLFLEDSLPPDAPHERGAISPEKLVYLLGWILSHDA